MRYYIDIQKHSDGVSVAMLRINSSKCNAPSPYFKTKRIAMKYYNRVAAVLDAAGDTYELQFKKKGINVR